MLFKLIFVFGVIIKICASEEAAPLSKIDLKRKEFLTLEERVWNQVLDHDDNGIGGQERNMDFAVRLLRQFQTFGDALYQVNFILFK